MSGDWWNESLDSEPEMPVLRNQWTAVIGWWSETSGSDQKQAAVIENDECAVPQTKEISNEPFITCNFICISRVLVIVNSNGFQFFLTPPVSWWRGVVCWRLKLVRRCCLVLLCELLVLFWSRFCDGWIFVWVWKAIDIEIWKSKSLTSAELVVVFGEFLTYATNCLLFYLRHTLPVFVWEFSENIIQ